MIPHGVEIFMGLDPIDLRWGFDRLAGIVRERLTRDARCGALFVFFGKRRDFLSRRQVFRRQCVGTQRNAWRQRVATQVVDYRCGFRWNNCSQMPKRTTSDKAVTETKNEIDLCGLIVPRPLAVVALKHAAHGHRSSG